jgi:hypothetical protein
MAGEGLAVVGEGLAVLGSVLAKMVVLVNLAVLDCLAAPMGSRFHPDLVFPDQEL